MATVPKTLTHTQQTQINFLYADIRTLEGCLKELGETTLDVDVAAQTGLTQALEKKEKKIQEAVSNIFKSTELLMRLRFLKAADIVDKEKRISIGAPTVEKDAYRRALEERIARSKDLLSDAIVELQHRITTIRGEPEKLKVEERPLEVVPVVNTEKNVEKDKPEPNVGDALVLKPTFMGVGVDLKELWRWWKKKN